MSLKTFLGSKHNFPSKSDQDVYCYASLSFCQPLPVVFLDSKRSKALEFGFGYKFYMQYHLSGSCASYRQWTPLSHGPIPCCSIPLYPVCGFQAPSCVRLRFFRHKPSLFRLPRVRRGLFKHSTVSDAGFTSMSAWRTMRATSA
jgi:hypothetical protein